MIVKRTYLFIIFALFKQSFNYEQQYKNYSSVKKTDCALLVIAYNRPEYFKECLEAIESNPESLSIPCVFALDGGPDATHKEHCALIAQSKIKHKIILLRKRNFGCAKNHVDAYRFVFDWCGFKKMIMIQEDIIISPDYISFLLNAHKWSTEQYTNIGAIHGFSYCFASPQTKQAQAHLLAEDNLYWLFRTFCMDHTTWHTIKQTMYTYEAFLDTIPHEAKYAAMRSKPGLAPVAEKIQKWMRDSVKRKKERAHISSKRFISRYTKDFAKDFTRKNAYVNEDNIMAFAFFMHDLVKLRSVVNRAITIGKYGISKASEWEMRALENNMKLDILSQDDQIKNFILTNSEHYFIIKPPKTARTH